MPDFGSRSERRLTIAAAWTLSALFAFAAFGLAVLPLGSEGDSSCGTVLHSYVGWSRCGGARRYALGGVIALAALAILFMVIAVRARRRGEPIQQTEVP